MKLKIKEKKNHKKHLNLRWEDITIQTIQQASCGKSSKAAPAKKLLSNVSGSVQSGEALAIIGGSGAGKTTLLNFLSKKIETENLTYSGRMLLNDIEIRDTTNKRIASENSPITSKTDLYYLQSSDLEAISAYVMQDDILEATMTPLEILLFAAKLKLNLSDLDIELRVHNMLSELNLQSCKDTQIGNNLVRGVSGGERKRTSIGVELIGDPQIVFLDEPTTGLDSYNAFEVVQNICELAREEGKMIIFTIHQPSSEIFQLLDKIFVLADGKTVYYGPSNECIDFFTDELRLPYPPNYNPFEFFIERTNMQVLLDEGVKAIKAYGDILSGFEAEDKTDAEKLDAFSAYIQLLSEIFTGSKRLKAISASDKALTLKENISYIAVESNRDYDTTGRQKKTNRTTNRKSKSSKREIVAEAAYLAYDACDEDFNEKVEGQEERSPQQVRADIDEMTTEKKNSKGFCYEFSTLFGRNTILSIRNKKILFFKIVSSLFTATLLSILFKNVN